ncbi:MAG: replication and repair protein RecF [Patescibacteria group bacterium]|nr:replication and repair protein RecF [Patescibacteria group bacterium]
MVNFRSYEDKLFEVDSKLELVVGPNGIGKTNLLEAIYLICQGKSFRLKKDSELIRKSSKWARIEAIFNLDGKKEKRILKLSLNGDRLIKRLEIDGVTRLGSKNLLPIVVFEPDQMRMITESPDMRRSYLDERISFLDYDYSKNLADYKRVNSQRNRLLKQIKKNEARKEDLFIWHVKMSELAAPIIAARKQYVADLNSKLQKDYQRVSKNNEKVWVDYLPNFDRDSAGDISNAMFAKLENDVERDILTGFTRTGPHRDDWLIKLNNHNASTGASRGEIRTLILSLKLYEFEHLSESFGIKPLVLLDDVMSELDKSRRKQLLKFFGDAQVIVSGVE